MGEKALIDLDHLNRYVAGDRFLRDEILGIFEEQAKMWTSMLEPSAEDTVWKDAAHALKGASRGVGAWEVGDLCAEAETMIGGNADDVTRRQALVSDLQNKVRATIEEVKRLKNLA